MPHERVHGLIKEKCRPLRVDAATAGRGARLFQHSSQHTILHCNELPYIPAQNTHTQVNELLYTANLSLSKASRSGTSSLPELQTQLAAFVERYAATAAGPTKWEKLAAFLQDVYPALAAEVSVSLGGWVGCWLAFAPVVVVRKCGRQ
jgi:hypothetical protein